MKSIAITGMAAKFAHFNDIDRIDRALYIGESIVPSGIWQSDDCLLHADKLDPTLNDLSRQVEDVLYELCSQTQQAKEDVSVFVISHHSEIEKGCHEKLVGNNWQLFFTLNDAMTAAQSMLVTGRTCAVIGLEQIDEVNVENISERQESTCSISFDRNFKGYPKGNGISGILLENCQKASIEERYIYAQIKAFNKGTSLAQVLESTFPANQHKSASNLASQIGQVSHVGLVEVSSLADVALADRESQVLAAKFNDGTKLNTAISCVKSIVGNSGGFSEVLSLVRTCLALQQRYIPNISGWKSPKDKALSPWESSNFYVALHAKTWFRDEWRKEHRDECLIELQEKREEQPSERYSREKLSRQAGYSCLAKDSAGFFLLEEPIDALVDETDDQKLFGESFRNNGFLHHSDFHLFILSGCDQTALKNGILSLRRQITSVDSNDFNAFTEHLALREIAKQLHGDHQSTVKHQNSDTQLEGSEQFTLVLLADSLSQLNKELDRFEQSLAKIFTEKTSWKTPNGSYFTPNPLGSRSAKTNEPGVAFLYPGIGATYVGLGRDLLRLFPDVFPAMTALSPQIDSNLKDRFLNPRSVEELSFKELKKLDSKLRNSLVDIAEAGVAYACLYSKIFENPLDIKAEFAAGYSMGEVSMYAALGCWQDPELMSERLASSPIFTEELAGKLNLAPQKTINTTGNSSTIAPLWETYSVKAKVAEVEPLISNNDEVFCTIVNTEDNLLLAGSPKKCEAVIEQLHTKAMPLNMPNIIHCELAQEQYSDMLNLYHLPMAEKVATKLYSSSCYLPIPQHSKAIAVSIAKCLCQPVDFPKLVNRMHDDGARLFVEMGAGRSLSGWVDKIIANKLGAEREEHLSLPINAKGTKDEITFFRAVAKLVSHGVNVNLSRFFNGSLLVNKPISISNVTNSNDVVELRDNAKYFTNADAKAFANTNNN